MKSYHELLRHVRAHGVRKKSRPVLASTGQSPDTFATFGVFFQHDLAEGFPLLTTKRTSFHNIVHENLWFLQGTSSIKYLQENGVKIWDQWAKDGDVGPVYGVQWRRWEGRARWRENADGGRWDVGEEIDQVAAVIHTLRTKPSDRRMVINAWNPGDVAEMGLPPCHMIFQFGVIEDRLNCAMFQRSADLFLGVPYNIAGYALLTHMFAHVTGFKPGTLSIMFGDLHLYENHLEQVDEQLSRAPRALPRLWLDPAVKEIDDFEFGHFMLDGYDPYPAIKGEVAV